MPTHERALHALMTADATGASWTHACELAAALEPFGVTVTLATMGAPLSAAQARTASALRNAEVFESAFRVEWMPAAWRDVDAAGDWLLALAQLVRPDVIHISGYAHAALPFDKPVVAIAHGCVCSWFRAVRGIDAGPEWSEYRARARQGLLAAAAVVAPTRAILRANLQALHADVAGRVIANGRTPGPADVTKEAFVLGAGRLWDEAKGLADLAACARAVSWPIRVAGPTVAPDDAVAPGRDAPARFDDVEVLGALPPEALAGWMARASVFALPARYEPFGMCALEAALAGCALVLGDIEPLREVWGEAALYVRPGDVDALAFALKTLARDPARRGTLATSARARAHRLTPARMATAYRALYDELAGAPREACA